MEPIIISGGGIAGLTLGIALKKQKIPFILLEKSPQIIKQIGGGIGLWGPALKGLKQLGVEDKLIGKNLVCAGYRSSSQLIQDKWLVQPNYKTLNRHTSCLCLRRGELQEKLIETLDSSNILYNSELKSFNQTSDAVYVQLKNGVELKGSILVGADGIHSITRKHIFPNIIPKDIHYNYWQGIGFIKNNHELLPAYEAWHPHIRFGMVPLPSGECFWFICSDYDIPKEFQNDSLNISLTKFLEPFGNEVISLVSNTNPNEIFRAHLQEIPSLSKWSLNRVICIGDSVHAMAPNLAQGACLAIEDSIELAHQLSKIYSSYQDIIIYQGKDKGKDKDNDHLNIINKSFQEFENKRYYRTKLVQTLVPLVHTVGALKSPYNEYRNSFFTIFPNWIKTFVFDQTHRLSLGWTYTTPNLHQGLYHRLLSREFLSKHSKLSEFHSNEVNRYCRGNVEITVGTTFLSKLLLKFCSLPTSNILIQNGEVQVEMTSNSSTGEEYWNRKFIDHSTNKIYTFNTTQSIYEEDLEEIFLNLIIFHFKVIENDSNFYFHCHKMFIKFPPFISSSSFSSMKIPVPKFLHPKITGNTILNSNLNEVGWKYDVEIDSPTWCSSIVGKLLRYEGNIFELIKDNQLIK